MRRPHDLDHPAIGNAAVSAQMDLGLGIGAGGCRESLRQLGRGDGLVIEKEAAARVQADRHRAGRAGRLRRAGGWQVQTDGTGQQGCGDDQDHHQHQHHIDQGRDVDIGKGP